MHAKKNASYFEATGVSKYKQYNEEVFMSMGTTKKDYTKSDMINYVSDKSAVHC